MKPSQHIQTEASRQSEISTFLDVMQNQYIEAMQHDDTCGMVETSGTLAISYSAAGKHELAKKWACEYMSLFFDLFPPETVAP